jgi:hypothetical protein
VVLLYYLCSYGESRLLVSWCARGRYDMAGNDEDHDRRMRPEKQSSQFLGLIVMSH